jgi:hypothetical protein
MIGKSSLPGILGAGISRRKDGPEDRGLVDIPEGTGLWKPPTTRKDDFFMDGYQQNNPMIDILHKY